MLTSGTLASRDRFPAEPGGAYSPIVVIFDVAAQAYNRFMGRWSEPLAEKFVDLVAPAPGAHVLDVGCGPGALTTRLVERLGADVVHAVDPSPPFVEATRARLPEVDVRQAVAEQLPFDDGGFDAALAQLVVHFMDDPVAGLREMGRVTRAGGVVASSVWDHSGDSGPLSVFWKGVREVEPRNEGESSLPGTRPGHLADLFEAAGLQEVQTHVLTVTLTFATFEDWWEPFTLGVGPAGSYIAKMTAERQEQVRDACRGMLPDGPFDLTSAAWCVTAHPR